jgi:dolichol-phosphate mannosyltransferase
VGAPLSTPRPNGPAPAGGETWVVLPTYNEAANLEPLIRSLLPILAGCCSGGFRILVVDDNSPDGTGDVADALAREQPVVEVLHRPSKDGLGRAYMAGFQHALARGAARIVEMDSDFSHDPAALPALLGAVDRGADLAVGSRYVRGGGIDNWGFGRRVVSRAGCRYARRVLGVKVHDLTGGYKCFDARALRALEPGTVQSQGYAFQVELTYRALRLGLRVVEVPIRFRERRAGKSKMSLRIALEAAWLVPLLRLRARAQRGSLRLEPSRPAIPPTGSAGPPGA